MKALQHLSKHLHNISSSPVGLVQEYSICLFVWLNATVSITTATAIVLLEVGTIPTALILTAHATKGRYANGILQLLH